MPFSICCWPRPSAGRDTSFNTQGPIFSIVTWAIPAPMRPAPSTPRVLSANHIWIHTRGQWGLDQIRIKRNTNHTPLKLTAQDVGAFQSGFSCRLSDPGRGPWGHVTHSSHTAGPEPAHLHIIYIIKIEEIWINSINLPQRDLQVNNRTILTNASAS